MPRQPRHLPPELWTHILRSLHRRDRRPCLSVSKSFHDIAVPLVFSHITVRFGTWRNTDDLNANWTEEQKAEADKWTRVSEEFLQHIIQSPELARIVTNVTVRAYTPLGEPHSDDLITALVGALNVLRLRAFSWYGCGPEPQEEVICALAETSAASLSEVILPPDLPEVCPWLPMLNQLKSLAFLSRYYDHTPDVYQGTNSSNRIMQTVGANANSLCRLSIYGEIFSGYDAWKLTSLVDLTLLSPLDTAGLHAVFEDCTQLRSLALCLDHDIDDLSEIFEEHVDALPYLTAFKFHGIWMQPQDVESLVAFLRSKASLERLDYVNQVGFTHELGCQPLLNILAELPRLSVFGCDVRIHQLTVDHLDHLNACIPQDVTALALNIAVVEWNTSEGDWARFFEGRSACRYLHVIPDSYSSTRLNLRQIAAQHPPPKLELLGYKDALRWMSHGDDDGDDGAWPPSRVYFRTVEDFYGNEEWEWLLRHRGHDPPLPTQTWFVGVDE